MNRYISAASAIAAVASVGGCATQPVAVPIAAASPPPVVRPALLPPGGAAANLVIPARRVDGSYPTPNEGLSRAGQIWHLRVALNVAALGCPGAASPLLVSSYNQMIRKRGALLATTERALIAEYPGSDGGRAAYDGAMTRLYNYFAQPPAQAGFCAAAAQIAREIDLVPGEILADYAAGAVARLDAPFTDFYRAYDAYLVARDAAAAGPDGAARAAIGAAAPASAGKPVRITVNPVIFKQP